MSYFTENGNMEIGDMFFRLYNPQKDEIVKNFNEEDWCKIFKNTTEEDLKELYRCSNVIILLWCDKTTNSPFGMVYFEEDYNCPDKVGFHGGTWNHHPQLYKKIFRSVVFLFDFVLEFKNDIITTCGINNKRADKFQRSLCFEETKKNDSIIYKTLNKQMFNESEFINRIRKSSV